MGSTLERSFVKGLIWEVISFVLTFLAVYIFYGNFKVSLGFSAVLSIIKISLFFIHERAWKGVKWGKIKDKRR